MYKRDHHVRIATVLQALNAELLLKCGCYFGGGTAIVLLRDEYRESADIDFLISNVEGFRELRQRLTSKKDILSITKPDFKLVLARDLRADQYGIRTMLLVGEVQIKFEIILEGRITLDSPNSKNKICGISTLTDLDMAASEILANSDRWADDSVFSRDLIDFAMLDLPSASRKKAMKKAKLAYGESAEKDLLKAIDRLRERQGRLAECMYSLKIDSIPQALLWSKIRSLK